MMNDDDVVVSGASGREAVEELRRSGALDALFERLDAGEVEMTGSQGLLPALLKEALERGLAAELSIWGMRMARPVRRRARTRGGARRRRPCCRRWEPSRSRFLGIGQVRSPRAWYVKDRGASMVWIR